MADSRKRKARTDQAVTTHQIKKIGRPCKKTKLQEVAYKSPDDHEPDVWQNLPAEIRNKIYEMVLIEDTPILVRYGGHTYSKSRSWAEPGILRVSKWIRAEAAAIYYENALFDIKCEVADFKAVFQWLLAVEDRCDPACTSRPSPAFYIQTRRRQELSHWTALAKYVLQSRFLMVDKDFKPMTEQFSFDTLRHPRSPFHFTATAQEPLDDVLAFGLYARRGRWSKERLETSFEHWVRGKFWEFLGKHGKWRAITRFGEIADKIMAKEPGMSLDRLDPFQKSKIALTKGEKLLKKAYHVFS